MAIISVNYNEGNKKNLGYKSVQLSYSDLNQKKEFASGNFIKDWYDCMKFIIHSDISKNDMISQSSSVDHFIGDCAPFDSAYLHVENNVPVLKYIDRSDPNWFFSQMNIDMEGIEFFVPKNTTPTWDELRVLCNDEKKQ